MSRCRICVRWPMNGGKHGASGCCLRSRTLAPDTRRTAINEYGTAARRGSKVALEFRRLQPSAPHRRGPEREESPDPTCTPQCEEALNVLRHWREQSGVGTRVFDVATGFRTAWGKALKRAGISKFRWHDLRHHFASRLVQHGVPLNTVRELLGHSTVDMSLSYARLAPDQRREAVAKLNERPLLTLTMR